MVNASPSSHKASRRMERVRQKGTRCEVELRRTLHFRRLRYRLQVPLITNSRRVADIVFRRRKLAIFVDGCFWHGCPEHGTSPKSNADFWRDKIETNKKRELDTNQRLTEAGWRVLRVWEHEEAEDAADRIMEALEFDV